MVEPGCINLAGADAAAVRDRSIRARRRAHGVSDQVADRGFARTHRGVAAVEFDRGGAERNIHLAGEFLLELRHLGSDLRVGRHRRGIDDAELRPPHDVAPAALLPHADRDVDHNHVMGVVARLDDCVAAVEIDEQVVVVAGEQKVDGARRSDLVVLPAVGVRDGNDEIGALAPQRLGLLLHGGDRRQEFQILRARCARRIVIGRAGESRCARR